MVGKGAAAEVLTEVAPERWPPLEVAEAQEASTGASLRDVMPAEVEVSEEELLVAAAAEVPDWASAAAAGTGLPGLLGHHKV